MADVRLGCHSLRDGVDAARTCLRVEVVTELKHSSEMLPMAVDAARFRSLKRLDVMVRPGQSWRPAGPDNWCFSVHLSEAPAWLHELHIQSTRNITLKSLRLPSSLPNLHTLEFSDVFLTTALDCAPFPGLQYLTFHQAVERLTNLATCSSLHVLKASYLGGDLDSTTLAQLQQLEPLILLRAQLRELDVPAISPGLTCLRVETNNPEADHGLEIDLALPGGAPRTALRQLGLRRGTMLRDWNLHAAPNLEALAINATTQLPPVLDLSGVPSLKCLNLSNVQLTAVNLSAARQSLVSLRLTTIPMHALDLSGCTALTLLYCTSTYELDTLDLAPVGSSLAHLTVECADKLAAINLAGCTALKALHVIDNPALTNLDLSACTSLTHTTPRSKVHCALEAVWGCARRQVVGAGPRVQFTEW